MEGPDLQRNHFIVLKTLLALVAVLFLAAWQSPPQVVRVDIDVKPGDEPTTIEPKREGMVPIAILTTSTFDAATVDPGTIHAGATGTEAAIFRSALEDVDRDRDTDMIALFRVAQMKLDCSGTAIVLTGKTRNGAAIRGTETVTMVGCP